MTELEQLLKVSESVGAIYSNFDHALDFNVQQSLVDRSQAGEKVYAEYPGWYFHANVFFIEGQFVIMVNRYHIEVAVFKAKTFLEAKDEVIGKFGAN